MAIDMAASGKIVDADKFLAAGGLDQVIDDKLEAAVLRFVAVLPARPEIISARTVTALPQAIMAHTREDILKRAKGQASPSQNPNGYILVNTAIRTGPAKRTRAAS